MFHFYINDFLLAFTFNSLPFEIMTVGLA